MKISYKQSNPNWADDYLKKLQKTSKKEGAVGFPAGKNGLANQHYESGASIIDVAIANNYGTETNPRRPFMDNATPRIKQKTKARLKQNMKALNSGAIKEEKFLELACLEAQAEIQNEITNGDFMPNSPKTIAEKGSSRPLIDSGDMRKSVTYVIRNK